MSNNDNISGSGIGIFGLLGVLFVGLKLAGFIDWSWWWVTIPFWGGWAFIISVFIIMIGGGIIARLFGK